MWLTVSRTVEDIVQAVRLYMRDFPALNRLIEGKESNDRMIAFAVVDAIDLYNATPPLIGSVEPSTFPSIHLLIRLVAACVLESVIMLSGRNYLSYSDGGGVASTSESNLPLVTQFYNMLFASNAQKMRTLKIALNIQGALGNSGLSSEYDWVHGYLSREDPSWRIGTSDGYGI